MNALLAGAALIPFLYWMVPVGVTSLLPRMGQEEAIKFLLLLSLAAVFDNRWLKALLYLSAGWVLVGTVLYLSDPAKLALITAVVKNQTGYVMMGAMVAAMVYLWPKPVDPDRYMSIVCVGALVQSLFAIPNFFGSYVGDEVMAAILGVSIINAAPGQMTGFGMENQNYLSIYLAMSVPFFFRSKKWAWGLVVIVPVLAMCKTTSAMLAALLSVCVLHPGALVLVAIAGLSYSVADWSTGSLSDRVTLWSVAVGKMSHPLSWVIGMGPGTQTASMQAHLHNEYLNILHDYGMVGVTTVLGFLYSLSTGNRLLVASGAAFCVHAMLNHPAHIPVTAYMFCITAGLIMRDRRDKK